MAAMPVLRGLPQGYSLLPLLMIYTAGVTERLEASWLGFSPEHHREEIPVPPIIPAMVQADDFALFADTADN